MKILRRSLMGMGVLMLWAGGAVADDGTIFRKNVSSTPDLESEFAAIRMLPFYVPAQSSAGVLLTEPFIEYPNAEGTIVETRQYARPLITHYTDGHVEGIDEGGYGGFPGHGERDAFGAVSLDDGATWKRTNLSKSADLSSFKIKVGKKLVPYPGDVGRTFAASDGNKVLIAWVSRYCGGGSPNYAMEDVDREAVATHLGFDAGVCTDLVKDDGTYDLTTPCLYLEDYFGVAGSQGSSDLADEGFPLIGELPFACVWTARGVINPPAAEGEPSTFTWFKAERLTSGVRDANRPEAVCVKGGGCVVTWQEDPEGIRPGEGEGPGEGWSGAIAHHQTDIWYSYISWDNFDLVGSTDSETGEDTLIPVVDYTGDEAPQVAVPMSMPVRLSDNAMCQAEGGAPYCYADFDESGAADFCASFVHITIETPEGPTQDVDMCIAEDGRLMRGNTAATRARLGLHGYSSICAYDPADPDACPIDSAWFSMAYEENKGLGEDGEDLVVVEKIDMGKNVWYHTFDISDPEVVSQGLMLNQPAVYPDDFTAVGDLVQDTSLDYNFYQIDPDPVYETLAGIQNDNLVLYQSEIARRPSPISQDWYDAGENGTVAFQLWKQGIIRRGGPADIMGRRFVIPDDFDATLDNPYDYGNMACDTWAFTDGLNPRYVKGLCTAPAVNLSGNTILEGECGDAATCLDAFPFNEYFDDYQGGEGGTPAEGIAKIQTWQQYGPGFGETITDTTLTNLDDVSWENPYDVAKGHRGFMSGDMIMAIYAWSPNWLANTVGHDNYNLYARRSFDGGQTWSTTPNAAPWTEIEGVVADGTTTCEWMEPETCGTTTVSGECPVCVTYDAGDFEQARNLSQLVGTQTTILDPRYSPTTRSITETSVTTSLPVGFFSSACGDSSETCNALDDTRDPSRFFIVYETGDNTTVAVGEAEPLDLFSSRAVNWGDDYLVWAEETDLSTCLPSAENEDLAGFCNEFEPLEGSALSESGEASITASPGGQFFYAVWNQVDFDREGNEICSDVWFRRVLFLDGYIPVDDGGNGGDTPVEPPAPPTTKPGKNK